MLEVKKFPFTREGVERMRGVKYGSDWPVVYILEDGQECYVGETVSAYARARQHLEHPDRKRLKRLHVVMDNESNKSATLDTESSLIEYFIGDNQFVLQNGTRGLQNHNYYDRERYQGKFDVLWAKLQERKLARRDLLQIRNSDLFKYSPYKTLSDDQYLVANELLASFKDRRSHVYQINGAPGTGKTILATYLIKRLVEQGEENVALVIAMTSLRNTLKKVFRNIPGLKSSMVVSPAQAAKKKYAVIVVDEAHRLRQRKNIVNYGSFDSTNKELGLHKDATELDWVLQSAEQVVLFFDENQSVRPSDISAKSFAAQKPVEFHLESQLRVLGGEAYLRFVDDLLECREAPGPEFSDYDFKIFDDVAEMVEAIKVQEKEHELSRVVAGYAWEWASRREPGKPDIVIGDTELTWNSKTDDWVNSENAINEVGCIHTIQGYDLNYAGVIIGPEIGYDPKRGEITIDRSNYRDANGHRGVSDDEELKRYIINIYKTLMTRGILGTYVYICDENLRNYFKETLGGPQ